MLVIRNNIVVSLFFIGISMRPTPAFAGCGVPPMNKITTGHFQVISTAPMPVPCVDSLDYFEAVGANEPPPKKFTAPGCLLKVKRLTSPEPGFNDDKTYNVYYDKDDCDKQIGRRLTLQLAGQCCPDRPIKCDQDPSVNKTAAAAQEGEMACAAPHGGRWMILAPGPGTDNYLKIVRERAKERKQTK